MITLIMGMMMKTTEGLEVEKPSAGIVSDRENAQIVTAMAGCVLGVVEQDIPTPENISFHAHIAHVANAMPVMVVANVPNVAVGVIFKTTRQIGFTIR